MIVNVRPTLPTPADNPAADVVIFDGHCRFCQGQVARIHRWDGGNRLAFISLHDPTVARDYPDLSHEQLMERMYIIDRQGHRYGGASAIRYLTRRLPWLWPAAPFLHIPGSLPVWTWLYNQVAKRRYRLGKVEECTDDACQIHFRK